MVLTAPQRRAKGLHVLQSQHLQDAPGLCESPEDSIAVSVFVDGVSVDGDAPPTITVQCAGDDWMGELGSVISEERPRLMDRLQRAGTLTSAARAELLLPASVGRASWRAYTPFGSPLEPDAVADALSQCGTVYVFGAPASSLPAPEPEQTPDATRLCVRGR